MIEKIVLNYLDASLPVPVYAERPEKPPETYVLIEKTGGGRKNWICTATIAIQSIAPTMAKAAELNEKVKTAMDGIIVLDGISKVELNSDYNFTDTASKKYRYQAVYDLVHY